MQTVQKYSEKVDAELDYYGEQISDKTKKVDSALQSVKQIPEKFLKAANKKVDQYDQQLTKTADNLTEIPDKYIKKIDDKIEKYSQRITGKTEKTLAKLSKWENKIHKLLQKVNPEAANRLFSSTQTTFNSLLQKLKEGEEFALQYKAQYNQYRDNLSTGLKYIESQKDKLKTTLAKPIEDANKKMNQLTKEVDKTEAIEAFIKERKKQLLDESIKYIGNIKYIKKINKEAYYYVETLKNYKQLFSDPDKVETTAIELLNKIPAFKIFQRENGQLSSMYGMSTNGNVSQSLPGLPSRFIVQSYIGDKLGYTNSGAISAVKQNLKNANSEMQKLKTEINKLGGEGSDVTVPDFKPNMQKTKTLLQRLEYGTDLQFVKGSSYIPSTGDLAFKVGYKINDKSIIGFGASYRMGIGSNNRIKITHQGIGVRSFIDWKLRKKIYLTGGFEMNYNSHFNNINQLKNSILWKQSGLLGLSKKMKINSKWFKMSNVQLLYDFLHKKQPPFTQSVLFRVGYNF